MILSLISNSLSLFGSLLISVLFFLFKELRNKYFFKLVFLLSIPAILHFIGIIIYLPLITGEK